MDSAAALRARSRAPSIVALLRCAINFWVEGALIRELARRYQVGRAGITLEGCKTV
jgi:hypothetical protein